MSTRNSRLISYKDAENYKLIRDMIIDVEMNPKKYLDIHYIRIFLTIEKQTKDKVIKCLLETLKQIYGFCVMNLNYLINLSGLSDIPYVKTANNNALLGKFDLSYMSISERSKADIISLGTDIRYIVNKLIASNKTDEKKKAILLDGIQSLFEFNCGLSGNKLFFYHINSFIEKVSFNVIDYKDRKYFDKYIKDIDVKILQIKDVDISNFKNYFKDKIDNYIRTLQKFNLFIKELLDNIVILQDPEKRDKYKKIVYELIFNLLDSDIKGSIDTTIFNNTFGHYTEDILQFILDHNYEDINFGNCKYKDIIYHTCGKNTIYRNTIHKICPLMDITHETPDTPETDQAKINGFLEAFNIDYCKPLEKQIKGNTSERLNLINRRSTSRRSRRSIRSRRTKRTKRTMKKLQAYFESK
jgi:hypothetical protein